MQVSLCLKQKGPLYNQQTFLFAIKRIYSVQSKHKRDLAKRGKRPLKKVQVFTGARGGPERSEVKPNALMHRGSLQAEATTLLQEWGAALG